MKAQIQNQVFIYIMAALIMGLTFYFGYKGIAGISGTASTAALVEFKKIVPGEISAVSYGETREYNLRVPAGYVACFINTSDLSVISSAVPDAQTRNFLVDGYNLTKNNLYLINLKTKSAEPISTVPLSVKGDVLCLEKSGQIILEKTGRIIEVRKR
jgi:hypothetical protein